MSRGIPWHRTCFFPGLKARIGRSCNAGLAIAEMMKTGLFVAKDVKGAVTGITPVKVHVRRKSEFAGTLIEVIVATVIIAIAGAGIIGSINYGMYVTQLA